MAGNSQRRGSMRKPGTKKGAVVGSGGQKSKGLQGRKATPPAEQRPGHPAARRAAAAVRAEGATSRRRPDAEASETVLGRNPVLECLRAGVPATALHVALGIDADDRVTDAIRFAADAGISILEVARGDLDRIAGGALHQGIALQVPPYSYAHPDDVLAAAQGSGAPPLLVALDGVTDPRNLGAVVRSAAAFGAHGVLLPQRRAAGMTAVAWRTSAGTAARIPVARATNLVRALKDWAAAGLMIVGLEADGSMSLDSFDLGTSPLVLVVGAEGRGLSRLVAETCDATVSIPMAGPVESLNASVAAGVVLAEVARLRRHS
ncbi:MAG: 23S rRNA (guanosine(2251)-2'-O)-methyltransferase RlmB [Chloroflexi bacterium]|nr:23S rRNA (guanosine(2251)-2'-O)-methyltransferase RlmB [Chloroflexota bacterium]